MKNDDKIMKQIKNLTYSVKGLIKKFNNIEKEIPDKNEVQYNKIWAQLRIESLDRYLKHEESLAENKNKGFG